MGILDCSAIKPEDLKNSDYLVKCFRKYLKKECNYSAEEARFSADIIENPFAKNCSVTKKQEQALNLDGTTYEVYFCTVEDCAPKPFTFYMFVDISTLEAQAESWFSYFLAKKKFVVCSN